MLVFGMESLASSLTSACNITVQTKAHFMNLDTAIELMGLRLRHQDTVTGGNPRN